jgi:hypothetical protein
MRRNGYAEYANDPYGTSEESVVAAFLSSRKQENNKKEETPAGIRPGPLV